MTTIFIPTDQSSGQRRPRERSGWLARCVDRVAMHWMRQESIKALQRLDDRELRDIGLTRSQIEPVVKGELRLRR